MRHENEIIITGFDADSEGSDSENFVKSKESLNDKNSVTIDCVDSPQPGTSSQFTETQVPEIEISPPKQESKASKMETLNLSEEYPDIDRNGNLNDSYASVENFDSPKIITTVIKRPRRKDFSKFNRSNRKSKNCATFYYKHVDTDSEQKNFNSAASNDENFLSSEVTSEEESWDYTNANATEINESDLNGNSMIIEEELVTDENERPLARRLNFGDAIEINCNGNAENNVPVIMQNEIKHIEVKQTSVISSSMVSKRLFKTISFLPFSFPTFYSFDVT